MLGLPDVLESLVFVEIRQAPIEPLVAAPVVHVKDAIHCRQVRPHSPQGAAATAAPSGNDAARSGSVDAPLPCLIGFEDEPKAQHALQRS
jgi:hypothetical protein